MLILNKKDIKKLLNMKEAIEAVKQAFRIFSEDKCILPLRIIFNIPKYEGTNLYMPCFANELEIAGVKIVSNFPHNIEKGIQTTPATMILTDCTTGEVNCIIDGTYLTQMRTGAAAGAATDLLARQDARIGALFGTGGQAASQLEAMLTVRKLTEVRIFDISLERARIFVESMKADLKEYGAAFRVVSSPKEAVDGADVITTVTRSATPVFDGRHVKAGAHINGIGSYEPDKQELDECIIQRAAKVFFDSQEAVLAESGDFIIPLNKGKINDDKLTGDLGALIAGQLRGRENDNDITIFKTVGISIADLVTADWIYRKAKQTGIGLKYIF